MPTQINQMDENPYQPPSTPADPARRKPRRLPYMFLGLLVGFVAVIVLLPAFSDSSGQTQTTLILGCLIGGPVLGLILELREVRRGTPREPKSGS